MGWLTALDSMKRNMENRKLQKHGNDKWKLSRQDIPSQKDQEFNVEVFGDKLRSQVKIKTQMHGLWVPLILTVVIATLMFLAILS